MLTWDPLVYLLASSRVRYILPGSTTQIEFMVLPDKFTSNWWMSSWRVIRHRVKPTMPLRGHHASINFPKCIFAIHFSRIYDPSVSTKEVSFVFIVFVSVFVNSYQRTSLQIIDPVNSQNNSFNWLCPRMKLDFFYFYFSPRGPRQDYSLTLLSSAKEKLSYLYIIQARALTFIKRMDILLLLSLPSSLL